MRDVIALVLAGGKVGDYGVLTLNRPKGALTFAGSYRIIDYALSSLRQAGIEQIGIVIQYLPASLIEHVGVGQPWDLEGYGRTLKVMPPFVGVNNVVWYKGTADALYQNLNFVSDHKPEHVIVLSGEHVYHLDFAAVMEAHRGREADITMVTLEVDPEHARRRFGYVITDETGRVTSYFEKPASPPSTIISTGIYIFRTSVLVDMLKRNAATEDRNLAKDILQPYASSVRSYEYRMHGYWKYLEGAEDYFEAQMELVRGETMDEMRRWGTLTNLEYRGVGFMPPAAFGPEAVTSRVLASPGTRIEGTVEESVLSPGVVIGRGAVVRRCVLMHDCVVGEGAVLERVIADKDVHFGAGCLVGAQESGGSAPLTLIGKGARIGEGVKITAGSQVRPGKVLADQAAAHAEI